MVENHEGIHEERKPITARCPGWAQCTLTGGWGTLEGKGWKV